MDVVTEAVAAITRRRALAGLATAGAGLVIAGCKANERGDAGWFGGGGERSAVGGARRPRPIWTPRS